MNIVEPILFNAKTNPDAMAICTPGTAVESVTYGQIARMIHNVGRMALSSGLKRGDIVAIHVADKIFHCALILGLARVGIATVSARTTTLPKEIGAQAVIADGAASFQNVGRTIVANPFLWTAGGDGKPLADEGLYRTADDELCRIILTSGTTGEAKGVAFTHGMMALRVPEFAFGYGNLLPVARRLFCDLGITTGPAFRSMLFMLWKGGTIFYFGSDAAAMVQAFDLFKVDGMITSPHGLSEYLRFYADNNAFQCPFEFVICQGSRLPLELSVRARACMTPNLFCAYGSTETGRVAGGPAALLADTAGAVGFLTPGIVLEVVDDDDHPLPAGREGVIRLRAGQIRGHSGQPSGASDAFRDGWFYPGDVGILRADGMLIISGRTNTVVNIGGDKLKVELAEEVLSSFPGVDQAGVFVRENDLGVGELWAAIVAPAAIDQEALRRHCREKIGPGFAPTHFVQVEALPRNESGKLDRGRLASLAG